MCSSNLSCDIVWRCLGEYRGPKKISAFIRYAIACARYEERLEAYRIYISDTMFYEHQNKGFTMRYIDIVEPQTYTGPSSEEVIANIKNKLKSMEEEYEPS